MRIAFVLTELTLGGAEMMLWKLLSRIDRRGFDPMVFALSPRTDRMLDLFRDIGVPCKLLGMKPSMQALVGIFGLGNALREARPDIVQGWLYHGNMAATLGTLFWRECPPIIWNIRGTLISREKRISRFVIWLGGRLSFLPKKIVNNSMASAIEHEKRLGYPPAKRVVLANGFDTDAFHASDEARASLRKMLGLPGDTLLIGLIGRYHPMKDHDNFLRAAALLSVKHRDVHYLLVGENVDSENSELRRLVGAHGLADRVHLLGLRDDMPTLTAALDISTSASSSGEGFPNVIGEAMSCGVPCVVTDVGDSALIVGDTGRSVPARDPSALAQGFADFIEMGAEQRRQMGRRARQRVIEHYSLDAIVRQYEDMYLQVHSEFTQGKRV